MPPAKHARSANHRGHNGLTRTIKLQPRRSCWHAARKLADPYSGAHAKSSGIRRNDFAIQLQGYEALIRLAEAIRSHPDEKDLFRTLELLQEISESIRQVMQCESVSMSLPRLESGELHRDALDFPGHEEILARAYTDFETWHPLRALSSVGSPLRRSLSVLT